ncbi:MAG: hypothetical protein V4633_06035 [Pseudomonadota bacterium]
MKAGAALLLALAMLPGCAVIAVTSVVVGTGVAVAKGTVAVGKGAVNVATYPFRDSEEEKKAKEEKAKEEKQAAEKD